MNNATAPSSNRNRPSFRHIAFLLVAIVVCSLLASWRTYRHSDSLTFLDATVCTDEGLLSLQIPLVRLAPAEEPSTRWITYKRGTNMWETDDGGGKTTLRNWMSMLDTVRCEGGMVAGFGFWKGAWQSDSRPGPFIVMFVPVWVGTTAALIAVAFACLFRVQFRLGALLMATTLVGAMLWLLSLRAVE